MDTIKLKNLLTTIAQINQDIAEDMPVFTTRQELESLGFVLLHSVWTLPEETWQQSHGIYIFNRDTGRLTFQGTTLN